MSSREIGKITSVGIHGVIADVNSDLGNYINTIDGILFVGEVGSYVSIYEIGRTVIAEIIGVDEKTQLINSREMIKPNSKRQVYLNLIGEIVEDKFQFGVSKMPLIFSTVYIVSQKELITMLEVGKEEIKISEESNKTRAILLTIGKSVIFPDYDVKINIDKFFGFHFAVFGNTGAGKSNTVARILQNVFVKDHYSAKGAKFVIIDSNGEYNKAFSKLNEINQDIKHSLMIADEDIASKFEIPVWALSADDWATLLHASEKTQMPVLKRAIDIARVFYSSDETNQELRNHILASTLLGIIQSSDSSPSKSDKLKAIVTKFGTNEINMDSVLSNSKTLRQSMNINYGSMPDEEAVISFLSNHLNQELITENITRSMVPYSLEDFSQAVEFATLYEGSISSQRIQEYTATLMTRLNTIQEGIQGRILSRTTYNTIDDYIDMLLGENQIVDLDISTLDDASAEVVTKVLAKLLLDYLKRREIKADSPINFIIEEAHRFIKNEANYGAVGYNIFERIAKEGRKFGMLLGISSQRPSELSKTVVSQCSNFIVHRVQNPDDLQYISRMVPYINQNMIERLTYLQTGNALVFGSAINLPTLTKFAQANPTTDSDNAKISEKWYIE
ncbi:ATP-binding protein [Streptobacillus moniliformis]|uniref:ATP-binding protein n=1 Tax=Streptobacillus moniliformis TaxID=34105 RepID=UPI0007E4190A|nr:ATP-binding protein [Streptobacillus moniliformis]